MSPTIFREGPYRFYFFASDRKEPLHVHVSRDNKEVKFWLETLEVAYNRGFPERELRKIARIVAEHQQEIKDHWDEFFAE